jgi:hypothetical protein
MDRNERRPRKVLGFESLEERALLSRGGVSLVHGPRTAELARVRAPKITTNPAGVAAVLNALNGGAGHEWVTLVRREVHNLGSVISGFISGRYVQYTIRGLVAKVADAQSLYDGPGLDREFLTEAGVILLRRRQLELAAITRGPFSSNSATSEVVFGIDRGKGASLGPYFASRPGITPDALVTVTLGPYGQNNSATITDLITGATQTINPRDILVAGPTVRVFISASQLPSEGFPISHYRFAAWTQIVYYEGITYSGISAVGSFAPESSMIPIGILTNVAANP